MRISFARVHGRTTEHIAPLITTLMFLGMPAGVEAGFVKVWQLN